MDEPHSRRGRLLMAVSLKKAAQDMNCGFHPKKKAVKQAKPVQLTYWTPICRGCDDELGASWGRKPLPKRKKRPTSNRD
jgi:hypothetical protein